jgi:hypothetical protein
MPKSKDQFNSLSQKKRNEIENMAREMVSGSFLIDAIARYLAMCLTQAIGDALDKKESKFLETVIAFRNAAYDGVPELAQCAEGMALDAMITKLEGKQ